MRRDASRLQDMLDAIAAIERYMPEGKADFEHQELVRVWVAYHLQIIGEAANSLSTGFLESCPSIPWHQIIGLRNRLVHEYFHLDTQILWDIVENDLPSLKSAIEELIENAESS